MGASDEGGGLADGPPLVVRNRLAVLVMDIAMQRGLRLVARRIYTLWGRCCSHCESTVCSAETEEDN